MSLVAYGSSDESDDDEVTPEEHIQNKFANNTRDTTIKEEPDSPKNLNANSISDNHKNTPIFVQTADKTKLNNKDIAKSGLSFGDLPKPKSFQNEYGNIPEEDDIPLFKPKQLVTEEPNKRKRAPAKISIPSLSEFKDVDEDLEHRKKKPAASKHGTGLFSILPPPKNEIAPKKNTLIPHVLTVSTTRTVYKNSVTDNPNVNMQKSSGTKADEKKAQRVLPMIDYNSNSEDDEEEHMDFFSLSKPSVLPEVTVPSSTNFNTITLEEKYKNTEINDGDLTLRNNVDDPELAKDVDTTEEDRGQNSTLVSTVMNLPRDEILLKNKAEVGPKLPVPEQEFNVDSEGNVAFDEKAIEYLCGKRGVKRKNKMMEEANIIEINGEDIKPDEREWLVKALTEEPVQRPVSMQGAGPSSQSKKKHQITYLAHQAKAMEVELKNTWSQNRMARKQTQSKYGF